MEHLKYGVWGIWLGSVAAAAWGSGWVATAGLVVFWLTLGAHVVEFFVKRPVMEQAGGSLGAHFVQTLIYGFFHWKPLEDRAKAGGDA